MSIWFIKDFWWGFALEILVLFYCFAGLAVVCDEYMVPALETLCVRWAVQEDVAGATFMAFGSAAPEIIINAVQTFKSRYKKYTDTSSANHDNVALGVGAIIGSGMIAFMIIPATCAIFSNEPLSIKRRPMARDVGFYAAALLATILFLRDEKIMCYEAAILCGLYICYVLTVVFGRNVRMTYLRKVKGLIIERQDSFVIREKAKRATSGGTLRSDMGAPLLSDKGSQIISRKQHSTTVNSETIGSSVCEDSTDVVVYWSRQGSTARDVENDSGRIKQPEGNRSISKDTKDKRFGNSEEKPVFAVGQNTATTIQAEDWTPPEGNDNSYTSEDEEETRGALTILATIILAPLTILFKFTCPKTEIGAKLELLYPVAFVISFAWIAAFSFVISEVVEEWVVKTGVNEAFFGLTLIAIGAEIPDTIQSVTVAKRGYGSMAVSNCIGSQIVNLCIGLGFSWLMGILVSSGLKPVKLTTKGVSNVFDAAVCQGVAILFCIALLFGPVIWSWFEQKKLQLGKLKGYILLFWYVATLTAFGTVEYLQGDL